MPRKGPPLTKLFLSYLNIEKGLSRNTIANYANDLARLTHFAYQAHKPIEQLQAGELRQFIAQLHHVDPGLGWNGFPDYGRLGARPTDGPHPLG